MARRIKILQVIHGMYIGGAENVVANIARSVDHEKYDINICCINELGELGEALVDEGFEIQVMNRSDGLLKLIGQIKQVIKQVNPDIVHTHGIAALQSVGPLYIFNRLPPLIHTFHFGNYPHIERKYLYMERLLARLATRLVAVSSSQRQAVIRHLYLNPEKVVTIFNGVPANPYRSCEKTRSLVREELKYGSQDIVIACIAVLSKQKGIRFLLDAFPEISAKHANARLMIVGGGPLADDLRQHTEALGIGDRVMFAGWRKDVHQLMSAIDIFALPSLWEGLPMVLLEAMSSGLPIVVTDVADNAVLIQNEVGGFVVNHSDSEALSVALSRMIDDMPFAKKMGEHARSRYEAEFTVDIMVENYQKLYKELA